MEADKVEPLTQQLESNVEEKNAINDEFNQLKEKIEEMKHSFQQEISQLQEGHKMEIERQSKISFEYFISRHLSLHNCIAGAIHSEEMKQYEIQIELAAAQRAEFEDEAIRARQEAQDAQEDVRISERRILSVTADLRRQLRGERRRADKLQERLRDVASDNSNTLPKADASLDHDNCSVSSWSLMSGQNDASATPSSPFPPTVKSTNSINSSSTFIDDDLSRIRLVVDRRRMVPGQKGNNLQI
jgi:uncharacterized phage infection (PIP) family protein YhgE